VCLNRLGAGGQATTWLAEPSAGGAPLLLKVFHVEVAGDWKAAELFERAARVLEELEHPNIPAYHDHFEIESDGAVQLCLAREFVAGDSLQDRIDQDGSLSEDQVVDLAIELLEVLEYLHDREPPIVHRDIKPANVILGEDERPYLVDFGAVQAEVLSETGGSTVVGTAGYVAPEQLMGRAEPSSDIYALGVTLVHLLTHTPPTELPSEGFELEFADRLEASAGLTYVIGRMTRADIDERKASAAGLLEKFRALREGREIVVRSSTLPVELPRGSKLQVVDEGDVTVQTPSKVLYWHPRAGPRYAKYAVYHAIFLFFMALPLLFWIVSPWLSLLTGSIALWFAGTMWLSRRRLAFRFGQDALHIQQPTIKPIPQAKDRTSQIETQGGVAIDGRYASVQYDALKKAQVVKRPSWDGTGKRWKLFLEADDASVVDEGVLDKPGHSVEGPFVLELNLTHGEYLWLAKLINKRVAQYRELEG
jgi:hypothetical protein